MARNSGDGPCSLVPTRRSLPCVGLHETEHRSPTLVQPVEGGSELVVGGSGYPLAQAIEQLRGHHVPAALGAVAQDVRADLTVLGVVTVALLGALLTGARTGLGQLGAVVRVPGHEPGVQGRQVGHVPAEAEALRHLLALTGTLVGAPFAGLGRLETIVDTLCHLLVLAHVGDLG